MSEWLKFMGWTFGLAAAAGILAQFEPIDPLALGIVWIVIYLAGLGYLLDKRQGVRELLSGWLGYVAIVIALAAVFSFVTYITSFS